MIQIKKYVSFLLALMIFVFSLVTPFNRAHALSLVDIPGYADEAFKAFMQGVFVVGGAAAHAGNYVEDNLKAVVDSAGLTYEQLAPEAKQLFLDSLTADGVVIAGDWISNFLDMMRNYDEGSTADGILASVNGSRYTLKPGYLFNLSGWAGAGTNQNSISVGMSYWENYDGKAFVDLTYNGWSNTTVIKSFDTVGQRDTFMNNASNLIDSGDLNKLIQGIALFGISVSVIGADGNIVIGSDLPVGQLGNIRTKLDEMGATGTGSLRLGVPAGTLVEPWAQTQAGNQRVYWDDALGQWTLPDGVPIPADQVLSRARGQGMYGDTPVVVAPDGRLVDLRTGQTVATREQAQTGDIAIPGAISKEWEFQDTLTKNPAKEESKDDTTTGGLAGFFAKLWEWLKKILDAILAIPKAIIDALKALLLLLFVPTDGFWTDNFNDIRGALTEKLGVDDLLEDVDQLGGSGGGTFKDVTVTLLGVAGLEVIDADSVNKVLDHIHKWVRGVVFPFLLFYNINQLYKLIRGTSLVEATRNLNRMKGD